MTRRAAFLWLTLVATVGLLAACGGVPTSSAPEVIRTVTGGAAPVVQPTVSPQPGEDPYAIVQGFLQANLSEDAHHTQARTFLTTNAQNTWQDTTAYVVDSYQESVADPRTGAVTVTGNELGTLSAAGVYAPILTGGGSTPFSATFGLQQVNGQWRIARPFQGLIIDRTGFKSTYQPRPVYFLGESPRQQAVPDLRYSALTDQSLCTWLLGQLEAPPSQQLQQAVTSEIPGEASRATATFENGQVVVNLPGISQQPSQDQLRLAAQLALTFQLEDASSVVLRDGTRTVAIPGIGTTFGASNFAAFLAESPPQALYYLRSGSLVNPNGVGVPGAMGNGGYRLTAVSVSALGSTDTVAATVGDANSTTLMLGTLGGRLTPVNKVSGTLTRPAWVPGLPEVWVSDGDKLYRVSSTGSVSTVAVNVGSIMALAFSPDGSRISLVVSPTGDSTGGELWVGSVVRSGGAARLTGLTQITPAGLSLVDVAWNDTTTLYTIGTYGGAEGPDGFWSVQVDGSLLTSRSIAGLPQGRPDAIAAAPNALPWISSQGTVWILKQNTWTPPGAGGEAAGTAPSYVQ